MTKLAHAPPSGNYSILGRTLSWAITPIYLLLFFAILVIFHPLQIVARTVFGYRAHMAMLNAMNFFLLNNFKLIGTRIRFNLSGGLPENRTIIFVSNHQSMYDIPLIIWAFRPYQPKFIAKVELEKGIPSISYALRHMGSVLIDRANPQQAIQTIKQFAANVVARGYAVCLFPEGTRGREGVMRTFKSGGLGALLESIPNAIVVPLAISGSWEMVRFKLWPVPFGVTVSLTQLLPIEPSAYHQVEVLCEEIEKRIKAASPSPIS